MLGLFRWLYGYVRFTFRGGFFEGFITECYASGYEIRDISKCEDTYYCCCKIKEYKSLHKIAHAHGGVVKCYERHGLPFLLLPLKGRWGFFVGAFLFVFIISFLSTFIWNVELAGNDRVSDTALMAYLENHNIKNGVMWSSVDRDKVSWQLMSEFEDFSWVHINRVGSTAFVEVRETTTKPKGDKDKLKGINVKRQELEVLAYREQKSISVKKHKKYKELEFYFISLPLYINKKTGDISEKNEQYLTLLDKRLPICIKESDEIFLSSSPYSLDDKELKALARKKLAYKEEEEFDGFEIINKTEDVKLDADKCVIKCSYILRRK